MDTAILFDYTMRWIWGDDETENDCPLEAIAVANYLKTFNKRNIENAFEVLDIMWPQAVISYRNTKENEMAFNVKFADNSMAIVICQRSVIGGGVEVV